jgi:hypothetical protein
MTIRALRSWARSRPAVYRGGIGVGESRGEEWPLSPPPLCVSVADEKFGLGTSRMSEIAVDRAGWTGDMLI